MLYAILQEDEDEIMNLLMLQNLDQQRQLHGVVINATLRFWNEYIAPLSSRDFKRHFRLSREIFHMLCRTVGPYIESESIRVTNQLSIECKVAVTLWRYLLRYFSITMLICYQYIIIDWQQILNTVR